MLRKKATQSCKTMDIEEINLMLGIDPTNSTQGFVFNPNSATAFFSVYSSLTFKLNT